MPITQTMVFSATPPTTGETPTTFNANAIACWVDLKDNIVPDLNTAFSQMNALETNVNAKEANVIAKEASTVTNALSAQGSANYQGLWLSQGYAVGQTVSDSNGIRWLCKLTHVTAQTPIEGTYWTIAIPYIGAIGNINSPLLDMPLKNSLAMKVGVGSATFTRASTATYIDRYGVLKTAAIDEPRFEKEGYLNEGASTNILFPSNDALGSGWSDLNITITASAELSPDGTLNAQTLTNDTTSASYTQKTITVTASTTYTLSGFYKKGTNDVVGIRANFDSVYSGVNYTFSTDTVSIQGNAVSVKRTLLANGWVRIEGTVVNTASTSITLREYTNGIIGETVHRYGVHLEALPFATSYIPTTIATVTRSADILSITASYNMPLFNGSISADFDTLGVNTSDQRILMYASASNTTTAFVLGLNATTNGMEIFVDGVQGLTSTIANPNTKYRWAISGGGSILQKRYSNGILIDTSISLYHQTVIKTALHIGSQFGTANFFYGHISNIRMWQEILTSQEVALA